MTVYQLCDLLHRSLRGEGRPKWAAIRRGVESMVLPDVMNAVVHRRAATDLALLPKTPKAIRRYMVNAFQGVSLGSPGGDPGHDRRREAVMGVLTPKIKSPAPSLVRGHFFFVLHFIHGTLHSL